MNARIWELGAALCLVASAAACKQDSGRSPSPAAPTITLTPSATSVVANGTNTVTFSVTDTGAYAVTLTTNRGTFPGGVTSYVIPAGTGVTTGSAQLTTCDSAANVGCAGAATVTASSNSGSVTASVNFTSLAAACQTNCGADARCTGQACTLTGGGTGSCSAGAPAICSSAPACTPTASSETACAGGADEDCNGKIDCADTACDGQPCDAASATSVCTAGKCTDLASGLAITITSDRARLPANGTTAANLVVEVTSGTDPAPNMAVTLSTTFGTLSSTAGTTDREGKARFTFTAAAPGLAVITAAATAVPSVTASTTITIPRLGSIAIPAGFATQPVMGVRSSGWNELSGVAVQVLDDRGAPYPDGLAVHFEHRTLGGSSFGQPTVACTATPAPCSGYDSVVFDSAGTVDQTGRASAPLVSGTSAGTLVVTATATAGGGAGPITRTVTLPGIAVVGARASLANFSVQCSPRNVPALAETDCGTSWVESQITCAAIMKDRFNNLLGTSTQVIFASEAAAVGQVAWSPAYDPSTPGADQADLGTATQIFQTLGAGLPFDVAPQAGEPSVAHALDGCGVRTHNPRDGVVTILAVADGEEAFFDANGNGQDDAGEPFVDQGEPFVDQDDNGRYDAGEWFLDVDGNGAYTGPNGQWDVNAKIWTQTVVAYTGFAAEYLVANPVGPTYLGSRWVSGAFTDACTPTPREAPFAVLAKRTGPPEIPPTSVGRVVVASDWNLNFLTSATTYGAAVEPPGKVAVTYHGLASYADLLGMSYQYWPCDRNGANCASQCRVTGANAPCLMKPALTGFSCGVAAGVTITGGDTPDGTNLVDFTIDVPWDVYLGGKVMHAVVTTSGTNN